MRRRASLFAALLALATLVIAPQALAASCPKTSLSDVEDEVMCIVCGTPLELATEAPQAERERSLITREIRRCRSKDEIKDTLVAQFGRRVLADPGDKGFNVAAVLVPVLAVILGGGAIVAAALGWRRSRRNEPAAPAEPPGPADRRLQDDLDRYEL